jgi:hypothetical protein
MLFDLLLREYFVLDLGKFVDSFVCLLVFRIFFFCVFLERDMKLTQSFNSKPCG